MLFSLFISLFFWGEDGLVDGPVIILYSVASREEKARREKKKLWECWRKGREDVYGWGGGRNSLAFRL